MIAASNAAERNGTAGAVSGSAGSGSGSGKGKGKGIAMFLESQSNMSNVSDSPALANVSAWCITSSACASGICDVTNKYGCRGKCTVAAPDSQKGSDYNCPTPPGPNSTNETNASFAAKLQERGGADNSSALNATKKTSIPNTLPLPGTVYGRTSLEVDHIELSGRRIVLPDGTNHVCSRVEINQCTPDGFDDGSQDAFKGWQESEISNGEDEEDDQPAEGSALVGTPFAKQNKANGGKWWAPGTPRPDGDPFKVEIPVPRASKCAVWRNLECIMRVTSGASAPVSDNTGDDDSEQVVPRSQRRNSISQKSLAKEAEEEEKDRRQAEAATASSPNKRRPPPRRGGKGAKMTKEELAAEQDPCINHKHCGGCLALAQCGWCGMDSQEGVCLSGSKDGPEEGLRGDGSGSGCDFALLAEHGVDVSDRMPPEISISNLPDNNVTRLDKQKAAKASEVKWSFWDASKKKTDTFPMENSDEILEACRADASRSDADDLKPLKPQSTDEMLQDYARYTIGMDMAANLTNNTVEASKAVPALLNVSGQMLPNGWSSFNFSGEVNPSGPAVGSQEFQRRATNNYFANCARVRGPAGCAKAMAQGVDYGR